ncbi:MAG: tagaturonate reductase [Eubacteriales bacterium]|nr:tagaturonate reductase [Eubacteriales bacterium]MDD3881260.1 tagaturonate reductase [Eubacteriales bacterium]MDD4512178.1 tagaturonate reductase [Eubacteriales bacterium]
MDLISRKNSPVALRKRGKEMVMQFGEGNFLRAFVDCFIDMANEKGVFEGSAALVQPIDKGLTDMINAQDGMYTLLLRGRQGGEEHMEKRVIQSVSRCIDPYRDFGDFLALAASPDLRFVVSNTTEAGIVFTGADKLSDAPQASFPGKVTAMLYHRYKTLGDKNGLIFLCCELIDANGDKLRECVLKNAELWGLESGFIDYVKNENIFCNTLVDRIVTGYPRAEAQALCEKFGYQDNLIDTAEPFGLWVIEAPEYVRKEFPLDKAGCPVVFTDDVKPYKLRKVRMLNGAHTSMVAMAYLAGADTVGECMADKEIRAFMTKALFDEIMPLLPLERSDLEAFASALYERFENPYNRHLLLSISLNTVSKYTARVLPSVKAYIADGRGIPKCLTLGMAALIAFYAGAKKTDDGYVNLRNGQSYKVSDDGFVLDFFAARSLSADNSALCAETLSRKDFWGEDLTLLDGFAAAVTDDLNLICKNGMRAALESVIA